MKRSFLPQREDGFTLVEIMVALMVAALVLAGMYQSFNKIQQWWVDAGARSDASQNLRGGLETITRDLEMTGFHATNYGDAKKIGLSVTLAEEHRIEVDQQRLDIANGTYEPRIVYYHLTTDVTTQRQNLYRQIRTEPGLPSTDELVAENIQDFKLEYFGMNTADSTDKNNNYPRRRSSRPSGASR
jgi:prepilin-type N-terminal cleavage/methylation domain-containing protein